MDYIGEVSLGSSTIVPVSQKRIIKMPEGLELPKGINIFDLMSKQPTTWPYFVSGCGDIDMLGEKKPQMLYRDVLWDNSKIEINVHTPVPEGFAENISMWGWPENGQAGIGKGVKASHYR